MGAGPVVSCSNGPSDSLVCITLMLCSFLDVPCDCSGSSRLHHLCIKPRVIVDEYEDGDRWGLRRVHPVVSAPQMREDCPVTLRDHAEGLPDPPGVAS
jgi:hypothetical protein